MCLVKYIKISRIEEPSFFESLKRYWQRYIRNNVIRVRIVFYVKEHICLLRKLTFCVMIIQSQFIPQPRSTARTPVLPEPNPLII